MLLGNKKKKNRNVCWDSVNFEYYFKSDNFDMTEYKYNYKRGSLSIPLFDEDGTILYDCIFIYNNFDVGSLQIYNRLRFSRKCIIGFPICYSFTDTKCEEAVRSRMIELMGINPRFSSSELVKIAGHSKPNIIRHYMTLKRKINSEGKIVLNV